MHVYLCRDSSIILTSTFFIYVFFQILIFDIIVYHLLKDRNFKLLRFITNLLPLTEGDIKICF